MIAIHLTLLSVLAITTKASEPQCSPFHFMEQILTKVVEVEMLVTTMKNDLETTQKKVSDKLQELDIERRQFKSDLDTELENAKRRFGEMNEKNEEQMQKFTTEFEKIKGHGGRQSVLFLAKEVTDITPNSGQRLVFKTPMVNEGNGYDNTTGIFTAPIAGAYLFTIQLCVVLNTKPYYAIVAENNNIKQGYFHDFGSGICQTADASTVLRSGGTVWITITKSGKLYQHSDYWNTFSGVLIH